MDTDTKSTHQAEFVKVNLRKHENADLLSLVQIYGYVYVGKTALWEGVENAVWFPPDTLLDTNRVEFAELKPDGKFNEDSTKGGKLARIKIKRFRGIVSYGYMTPAQPGDELLSGKELFNKYGCAHYDPPLPAEQGKRGGPGSGGEVGKAPALFAPKYDVDSFQRYAQEVFVDGEPVFVTEKIHGANGRWVFHNGEFYCGSRTEWKKEFATPPDPIAIEADIRAKLAGKLEESAIDAKIAAMKAKLENFTPGQNMWWKALRNYPDMMKWLESNPDYILYGEVYGQVQDLKYGTKPGELRIGIFDLMKDGVWDEPRELDRLKDILPIVPIVAEMPYNFDKLVAMAEGTSLVPGAETQIREGIVVKPIKERTNPAVGRVQLKIVSPSYLER